MAKSDSVLVPDCFYHVFNQAVGWNKLFTMERNYIYFLGLYRKYICPIAHTYAFCLLPDQFDFFIQIRSEEEVWKHMKKIKYRHLDKENIVHQFILQQFSNFFNAYAKAFNIQEHRKGRLFIESFQRRSVVCHEYFPSLIHYLQNKPVRKGYCDREDEWYFSSWREMKKKRQSWINKEKVFEWFGSVAAYENFREKLPADSFWQF